MTTVRRDFTLPGRPAVSASPAGDVVPPRLASTVMLIRDGDAGRSPGLQVFMMRRAATMRFAPSAWVFPGGGVDERDGETPLSGADEAVPRWSTATGVSDERIRALAAAAAREVFEECGVLLAGSDPQSVVSDLSDPSWRADREALESHELSFAELLQRRGLVLRTDLLNLHDRWVTPEFEKVRYDTFFFAALMPPGQSADDAGAEVSAANWVDPAELLEQVETGTARMLPPTRINLERIEGGAGAAAFVTQRHPVATVQPRVVSDGESTVLRVELPRR